MIKTNNETLLIYCSLCLFSLFILNVDCKDKREINKLM